MGKLFDDLSNEMKKFDKPSAMFKGKSHAESLLLSKFWTKINSRETSYSDLEDLKTELMKIKTTKGTPANIVESAVDLSLLASQKQALYRGDTTHLTIVSGITNQIDGVYEGMGFEEMEKWLEDNKVSYGEPSDEYKETKTRFDALRIARKGRNKDISDYNKKQKKERERIIVNAESDGLTVDMAKSKASSAYPDRVLPHPEQHKKDFPDMYKDKS